MESHNGYRAKEGLKMFCSRCGNQMEMNARFCTRCGFELEIAIPQQKNQLSVVQEPIVAHPEVDRKSCNSVKRVKMVVAIIAGITSYFVGSIFASNLHSYLVSAHQIKNIKNHAYPLDLRIVLCYTMCK